MQSQDAVPPAPSAHGEDYINPLRSASFPVPGQKESPDTPDVHNGQ